MIYKQKSIDYELNSFDMIKKFTYTLFSVTIRLKYQYYRNEI